jgi:hypothetical protein
MALLLGAAFGAAFGGLGGAAGGAAAAPVDVLAGQPYMNVGPNVNVVRGIPRATPYVFPPEYHTALQFQEHYEKIFDAPDTAGMTAMESFRVHHHTVEPLDHMTFPNVDFIMTVFDWAGVNAKNGVLYSMGDDEMDLLMEPMSSDHMGLYVRHLQSLYTHILVAPSFADVLAVCPHNAMLYNADGSGFCNQRIALRVTDATQNHGYTYMHAMDTLWQSSAFGPCLFRFNMARCVQRV